MHPCPLNFTNVISSNYIESLGECLEFLIYLSNIEFKIEIYTFISQKPVAFILKLFLKLELIVIIIKFSTEIKGNLRKAWKLPSLHYVLFSKVI